MLQHMSHSHLEFQFLILSLGLMLTFLVLYGLVCWRESRRGKPPKYSKNLRRRLQAARQKLKRRRDNKEEPR